MGVSVPGGRGHWRDGHLHLSSLQLRRLLHMQGETCTISLKCDELWMTMMDGFLIRGKVILVLQEELT